jgi:hypothetical protein
MRESRGLYSLLSQRAEKFSFLYMVLVIEGLLCSYRFGVYTNFLLLFSFLH